MPSTRASAVAIGGRWGRFLLIAALTTLILWPIGVIVVRAFTGFGRGMAPAGFSLDGILGVFRGGPALQWFGNSLAVSLATVVVTVAVAGPAGYVLSRARGRWVSGYALAVFVLQSLPVLIFVIPLFIVFARWGLVDNLAGVTILYIGSVLAVGIWMMAAFTDSIPIAIEEAAWLDGCSVAGAYRRIVLRNSLPAVLSTAIFAFLLAWNEYLVAVVFLRSDQNYTLAIALSAARSPALAVVMMLPPIILFASLNRFFTMWTVR